MSATRSAIVLLVGAVVGMASTSVQAVVVGAAVGVAVMLGPWWRFDGGHVDDGGGGSEGGPEPVFRRFLYRIMVFFWYRIVFVPGFYLGIYVLWSA